MNVITKSFTILLLIILTISCQSTQKTISSAQAPDSTREAIKGLTQAHAEHRAKVVTNTLYKLDIDLLDSNIRSEHDNPEKFTHFNGKVTIDFHLNNIADLTLDFNDGEIQKFLINGHEIATANYNKLFLNVQKDFLTKGANQIIVIFRKKYATNGAGLYKFYDREDKQVYLYTQFEPFDANNMFPCFDQPDLKAHFELKVRAPKDWIVSTSVNEEKKTVRGQSMEWAFPKSERMSPYTFSLHAGPYKVWSDTAHTRSGKVPLRLMARQSLAKYVQPATWFRFTKHGMKFFEKYFDYEYPYKKYDQLIVPDFNYGAMENIAAVTFSEKFIIRGKITKDSVENLGNTLLHELAHMWFGNLVTMKWWNDLWLNESFATIMAYKALVEHPGFENAWQSFASGTKKWAYWTDQLVTTHPIELDVPSTEEAFTNFDGITYGKGASSLKQLAFYIGEENFKNGIQKYFKAHANSNTVRSDFTNALSESSKLNLTKWSQEWLQTAGLNTVEAKWACKDKKISEFSILQHSPVDLPQLRTHKLKIGLFKIQNGRLKSYAKETALVSDSTSQFSNYIGRECPDLVYPNYEDYGYVKVLIDPISLKTIGQFIGTIEDDLTRHMIWVDLWNMVRDQKLAAQDYVQTLEQALSQEKNEKIYQTLVNSAVRSWDSVNAFLPSGDRQTDRTKQLEARLESLLWREVQNSKPGSDTQKLLMARYLDMATSSEGLERITKWLTNKAKVPAGFHFDQDLRWSAIGQLKSLGHKEADLLLAAEKTKDKSDWGAKSALTAEVLTPDLSIKKKYYLEVVNGAKTKTLGELKSIMGGILPIGQRHLAKELSDDFYKDLQKIAKESDSFFIESFVGSLTPTDCTKSQRERLEKYLEKHRDHLPYQVIKSFRITLQEDARCEGIQNLMNQNSTNINLQR